MNISLSLRRATSALMGLVVINSVCAADFNPQALTANVRFPGRLLAVVGFAPGGASSEPRPFVATVSSSCLLHGVASMSGKRLDGRVVSMTCQDGEGRRDFAIEGYVFSADTGERGFPCDGYWCGAPMGHSIEILLTSSPAPAPAVSNVRIDASAASNGASPKGVGR